MLNINLKLKDLNYRRIKCESPGSRSGGFFLYLKKLDFILENKLWVMRGLPGSGKTSYVNSVLETLTVDHFRICSADKFFEATENGVQVYKYDSSRQSQAHERCKIEVVNAMISRVPFIVVDNTCSKRWEWELYVKLAQLPPEPYEVSIIELVVNTKEQLMQIFKRQVHNVPLDIFLRMWWRWEDCVSSRKIEVITDGR